MSEISISLPLSDGLLLVLPLGRPGPRRSGSCCVPLDAAVVVVVVVVEDEEAEQSFFRRIRARGPETARRQTTLGRGISSSCYTACLGSQLNSCSAIVYPAAMRIPADSGETRSGDRRRGSH